MIRTVYSTTEIRLTEWLIVTEFYFHTCGVLSAVKPPGIFVEEHLQSGAAHGDELPQYGAAFP